MPHFPKPFFKKAHGLWYVQIDGKQINLGSDRDPAFVRYHELMQAKPTPVDCTLVVGVLDRFLDWCNKNRPARTFEWYQRHLEAFAKAIPRTLAVGHLKPFHVTEVLGEHENWSPSTKNGFCRAIKRAFKWAEEEELIDRSPVARLKKPKNRRREIMVSLEEFEGALAGFKSRGIRDLLITVWESGCRPQEVSRVEARHFDSVQGRWLFPVEESKGKNFPRVVYLTGRALEITRRLVLANPTGPLFRNEDGKPWNRHSIACAFGRLQVAAGIRRMRELGIEPAKLKRFNKAAHPDPEARRAAKAAHEDLIYERRKTISKLARRHGQKLCAYALRHSWATHALRRGVDALTVAILMGHADPSMLAKVYAHLSHDPEYLRGAAKKATEGLSPEEPAA